MSMCRKGTLVCFANHTDRAAPCEITCGVTPGSAIKIPSDDRDAYRTAYEIVCKQRDEAISKVADLAAHIRRLEEELGHNPNGSEAQ